MKKGCVNKMKQKVHRTGLWLVMVCLVILLAACSSEASSQTSTNEVKAAAETAEEKKTEQPEQPESKTRIIKTVTGDVEVPTHPERVIVDWNLGNVLALGIEPVGASKTILDYGQFLAPYVTEKTQDIGRDGQVSLEKMLELKPDLIITWDAKAVEQYSKIAPTVVYDTTQYPSIPEQINAMGDILNRQKEAKEWLDSFDKRVAEAKAKIKEVVPADATFSIIDVGTTKTPIVVGQTGERGGDALYQILGVKPQPLVKSEIIDKKESRADISWEKITDYAGDYIFLITQGEGTKPDLPSVWNTLDAVKNNHVYEINIKRYFTSDPLSALLQAEEMAGLLTAAKK